MLSKFVRSLLERSSASRELAGSRLWSLALIGVALSASAPQSQAEEACRRVALAQPLPGAVSGAWDVSEQSLIVADAVHPAVLFLSTTGELLRGTREFVRADGSPLPMKHVSGIRLGLDGGTYVRDRRENIIAKVVDMRAGDKSDVGYVDHVESVVPVEQPVAEKVDDSGNRLLAIDAWQPMNEGFVAFGDIQFPKEKGPEGQRYGSGFVHFDATGLKRVYGESMAPADAECNHYLGLAASYLTTLDGEQAYALRMSQSPALVRMSLEDGYHEVTGSLPQGFSQVPLLERNPEYTKNGEGARQTTEFFELIEDSAMPRGLYSWDNRLFLLAKGRISREMNSTPWWLVELNSSTGAEIARFRLPTQAAHLVVIGGGTSSLALIEKDAVQGLGDAHAPFLEAPSLVLFPKSWLAAEGSSPLRVDERDLGKLVPGVDCGS